MRAFNFYMFDNIYLTNVPKSIHLEPHLPYLYMPSADYTHFAFTLNSLYKDKPIWDGCDYTNNYCRFNTSCDAVKADITDIPFSIELNDTINFFNLTAT